MPVFVVPDGGFHSQCGYPEDAGWFFVMENPKRKWMMKWRYPHDYGNAHILADLMIFHVALWIVVSRNHKIISERVMLSCDELILNGCDCRRKGTLTQLLLCSTTLLLRFGHFSGYVKTCSPLKQVGNSGM